MAVIWTRLAAGHHERCASASCEHSAATWRMDAGERGSFFCGACHDTIVMNNDTAPTGNPLPADNDPPTLEQAIREVINRHSAENASDTPDFILAEYVTGCLDAFNQAVRVREKWYGRRDFA